MLFSTNIETPIGLMKALSTERGLCYLCFDDGTGPGPETATATKKTNHHLDLLRKEISGYFQGKIRNFTVELDPAGTPFQLAVWAELVRIEYGRTRSYLAQAHALGRPGSVRAVANANAANKIAVIIPCHRVIGSNGTLIGYSGGLSRKRWLLEHEQKYSDKNGKLF